MRAIVRYRVFTTLLACAAFLVPATGLANATTQDVLGSVQLLEDEVERVRAYMGRQSSGLRDFIVDSASPRHSYFLAQQIVRKLNVLIEETAGGTVQSPPIAPNREITAEDIMGVLSQAHSQINYVAEDFGILEMPKPRAIPRSADETSAVEAMVRVLRQINLMLVRRYLPNDVFSRLDLATVYVAGVLKNHGLDEFPEVEFVPYKQPVEVFRKILDIAELSASIADLAGVEALALDTRRMRASDSRLSNNYDLMTVLLSDIAEWTEALEGADDVFPENELRPHIVPSHVFQKAAQLEAQLRAVHSVLSD